MLTTFFGMLSLSNRYTLQRGVHFASFNAKFRTLTTTKVQESRVLHLLRNDMPTFKNEYPMSNISESIANKLGRNLHLLPNHPLNIIKTRSAKYTSIESLIKEYFMICNFAE